MLSGLARGVPDVSGAPPQTQSGIYHSEVFRMKNKALMIAGIILLMFALVCPLPPLFGISGIAWRTAIGAFGCVSLALGVRQTAKR